jgi:hypothetical protein
MTEYHVLSTRFLASAVQLYECNQSKGQLFAPDFVQTWPGSPLLTTLQSAPSQLHAMHYYLQHQHH